MHRYLVVANQTLGGEHLVATVRERAHEGPCSFHIVVPVTPPTDHAWTEGEIRAVAQGRLDRALARFREEGADATGEVGDANPVYAVSTALRNRPFGDDEWDGIIVSTLPPGVSHWLGLDVVSRIKREFDIPVTHLVAPEVQADA